MTTGEVLSYIGFTATGIGIVLIMFRRIKPRTMFGLCSLGNTLAGTGSIIDGSETWVIAFSASVAAYFAHKWWNDDDDDHPRRRLKRWVKKFQPTRRTAPAAS